MAKSQAAAAYTMEVETFFASINRVSLLIVRHPFTRLVATYKTQFEQFNYKTYIEHGIGMYREGRRAKPVIWEGSEFEWIQPLFSEYIEYILKRRILQQPQDELWRPINELCQVCTNGKYDYIMKSETLEREEPYLWTALNVSKNENVSKMTELYLSESEISSYFQLLTKTQIEKLTQMYWWDFEHFGYNPKIYLTEELNVYLE
jgi:hypothetical protein